MRNVSIFNTPIELGVRALVLLDIAYPSSLSLQQIVAMDYLLVHSDDTDDGPSSIHPSMQHRGGEYIIKREAIYKGVLLYASKGLIEVNYSDKGLSYFASEQSRSFLDALNSSYINKLKSVAIWVIESFSDLSENKLIEFMQQNINKWGVEFEMESMLWGENQR